MTNSDEGGEEYLMTDVQHRVFGSDWILMYLYCGGGGGGGGGYKNLYFF